MSSKPDQPTICVYCGQEIKDGEDCKLSEYGGFIHERCPMFKAEKKDELLEYLRLAIIIIGVIYLFI